MQKIAISSTKSLIFGDCVITSIKTSAKNPAWTTIKIEQETTTAYEGNGNGQNFLLNSMLGGNTPLEYKDIRKNTTSVKTEVASQLAVGQVLPNVFINRITHDSPQWDDQTPATNGKYYTSILETEAKADRASVATTREASEPVAASKITVSSMEIAS
jgi:hypothetical protein